MSYYSPNVDSYRQVQLETDTQIKLSTKRKGHLKAGAEYMSSTHEYVLYRGSIKTGIFKTMTGREAKLFNAMAVLDFGAGKTSHLYAWKWDKNGELINA
jgi:hypothetical protein